ncbi:MAG: hypothetical protein AAB733_00245 [Patescibacteria group bacterium]
MIALTLMLAGCGWGLLDEPGGILPPGEGSGDGFSISGLALGEGEAFVANGDLPGHTAWEWEALKPTYTLVVFQPYNVGFARIGADARIREIYWDGVSWVYNAVSYPLVDYHVTGGGARFAFRVNSDGSTWEEGGTIETIVNLMVFPTDRGAYYVRGSATCWGVAREPAMGGLLDAPVPLPHDDPTTGDRDLAVGVFDNANDGRVILGIHFELRDQTGVLVDSGELWHVDPVSGDFLYQITGGKVVQGPDNRTIVGSFDPCRDCG